MVWVDIAIIALIVIYSVVGLVRGYSQEIFALLNWLIGIVIAWFFSKEFALLLIKAISTSSTRLAVAFMSLILITLVIGKAINVLSKSVKKTGLSLLDHLGGLLLGLGHGLVVAFVLVVAAGLTALPKDRWWQESKYLPPFQSVAIAFKETISTKLASSINYR